MTDSLFFDCDCISAFLWVNNASLLALMYPGKIVIPKPVYDELSYPTIPHLKDRIDALLKNGQATIESISIGTDVYAMYYKLSAEPDTGHVIIGKGEAASIALAKCKNGIVASNNLKDISVYIKEYRLRHITTADLLVKALNKGYINKAQGDLVWAAMLKKRRKLGAASFSDYLICKSIR